MLSRRAGRRRVRVVCSAVYWDRASGYASSMLCCGTGRSRGALCCGSGRETVEVLDVDIDVVVYVLEVLADLLCG